MKKKKIGQVKIPPIQIPDPPIVEECLDIIYPIGTIYLSYESASPAELFGGTWTQLENVFLRAANDTNTGGSDNVTLTVAQLASHNHTMAALQPKNGSVNSLNQSYIGLGSAMSGSNWTQTVASSRTGSNAAHSNMPAYQNVYCWERIN